MWSGTQVIVGSHSLARTVPIQSPTFDFTLLPLSTEKDVVQCDGKRTEVGSH